MNIEKLTIAGPVPEKDFICINDGNRVRQNPECIVFEKKLKTAWKQAGCKGWLTDDIRGDMTRQAYTALRVLIYILAPHRRILIKQVKAILDALKGCAYVDDRCVVDLYAEYIPSQECETIIDVRPADKSLIRMPDTEPVVIDGYISPIKASAIYSDGKPMDRAKAEGDERTREWLRSQIDAQYDQIIDGDAALYAVLASKDVAITQPISKTVAQLMMDELPICTPDIDNATYAIISAIDGHLVDMDKVTKLHIVKTYCTKDHQINRIWLIPQKGVTA